jgi:septum formation protein
MLAEKKALFAQQWIVDDEIVLASDTTVILNNQLFEKPIDIADARRILRALSGNMHRVKTGVCLVSKKKKRVFADVAKVYFDHLTDSEIDFYIENYKPFDKAGAYAVQDWIGHCKIRKIEGSYETIMGLPTHRIFKVLLKSF